MSQIDDAIHSYVEELGNGRDITDVKLRFKNVKDKELLMIELDIILDSLHEEGWLLECDEIGDYNESESIGETFD